MYFASLYSVYATTGGGATGYLAASVYMAVAYSCVARGGCLVGGWYGGAGKVHVLLLYEMARG